MPLRVEISHPRKFVYVVAEGPVTLSDMERHFDKLFVENALGYAKLFDATNLVPVYDERDAMVLGARLAAYTAAMPSGPLAVVGRSDAARDSFKHFVNLSPSKRPAKLFPTEHKALAWLRQETGTDFS